MDELTTTDNEAEWQACARWIKYEEDVQPGSDRWGKPHLSSLSFQSLMHLRRCLEKGATEGHVTGSSAGLGWRRVSGLLVGLGGHFGGNVLVA